MDKILVLQTSFIGDVILSTVIWEKLHEQFPPAKIDVMVRKGNEGLLKSHPFLNEVIVWDKKNNKYKNLWAVLKKVRGQKYDLVINLQRFFSTGILTGFSNAIKTIGFDVNPLSRLFSHSQPYQIGNMNTFIHETDRYHSLLHSICSGPKAKMKLYPSKEDNEKVAEFKDKEYVCLFPASVWFTKQLPPHKWVDLINHQLKGEKIFLCGAQSDLSMCQGIKDQTKEDVTILAGKLSLLESAALIKDSKMTYCNDSAPSHIATAMNAPVTCFFLSTVPAFGFSPLSDQSRIVEVEQSLSCRPCGIHGHKICPKGHFDCANLIDLSKL